MRKKGLGRGLSDLLSGEVLAQSRAVVEIPLDEIEPNPRQPRQTIQDEALEELTVSIETHGVLQPIIVRGTETGYQIVAGERRWRAARRAGLRTIPCLVQNADDLQSLELAMVENLQRDDLNAVDAARGYRMLAQDFGMTQEEVARKIGKSRSAVANTMRLLDLPEDVQEQIRLAVLTEGHGRALLALSGRSEFAEVLAAIVEHGLSVRETERAVREVLNPEAATEEAPVKAGSAPRGSRNAEIVRDPHIAAAEQRLRTALATKVVIRPSARRGGVIHIRYYDSGDLDRLLGALGDAAEEE